MGYVNKKGVIMRKLSIIVAHPYQQHSFQTASAIKHMGDLQAYITTVYDKNSSITALVKKLLKGDNLKRANNRRCSYLSDNEVIQFCEFESLLLLLLHRIDKSRKFYDLLNAYILKKFNRKLAKYIMNNNTDAVILYDTLCAECIRILRENSSKTKIIIDMSAPNFSYMDHFFSESVKKYPKYSLKLKNEMKSQKYLDKLADSKYEIDNADYFLVASQFSKKSLIYSGINENTIFVCKYGINMDCSNIDKQKNNKVRIIFIGDVNQKKGIVDFVQIARELNTNDFEFNIVGKYEEDDPVYTSNKDLCNFYGYVTHDEVLNICENMDIIIFPSLSDGFGLSVIEAMSKKVVPIVSTNAGVSDIVNNGINGFIFNIGDIETVVGKCRYLQNNFQVLNDMQNEAYKYVSNMKWTDYYKQIEDAIVNVFEF